MVYFAFSLLAEAPGHLNVQTTTVESLIQAGLMDGSVGELAA
jgi:hypothetical protein